MPNAVITDTYLTTTPWSRKTDFYNAFKTAVENAGFPSSTVNEYDRRDNISFEWLRGGYSEYNANGSNSIKGFIKEVVLDGSKAKGTIQCDFFTLQNSIGAAGDREGITRSGTSNFNQINIAHGMCAYWGGWGNANAQRILFNTTDTAIGSWYSIKPTYTSNNHNFDNAFSGILDGNGGASPDGTWNGTPNASFWPLGSMFTPGTANSSQNGAYGVWASSNAANRALHFDLPVQFKAINHPEIRGVFILQQHRSPWFHGYVRPAIQPSWWNEDNFPYVFIPVTPLFNLFQGFSGSYFPIPSTPWFAWHELVHADITGRNPFTNKIDAVAGPMIRYAPNTAILGKFSDDIILTPPGLGSLFDRFVVTAGVQEYLVISGNRLSTQQPGLAIRII